MIANAHSIVSSNPHILGGTLVFAGTRVPVETLIAHLRAGDSIETFLADFPSVSRSLVDAYLDLSEQLVLEKVTGAHSA